MMHSAAYVHSSEQQQQPVYSAGHVEGEQGRQGANAFKLVGLWFLHLAGGFGKYSSYVDPEPWGNGIQFD